MKRLLVLTAASVFALAAPAVAQTDAPKKPLPETATPDTPTPDPNTTQATQPVDAARAALDAINNSKQASNDLGAMTAVSTINVVKISEIGGDPTEFQSAIDANKDHATGVQAAIKANPALSAELDKQMLDVSAVVAAQIEADGSVTIYTQ
jgi:hypothetical protein